MKTLPTSIKEKRTHWPEGRKSPSPQKKKKANEDQEGAWQHSYPNLGSENCFYFNGTPNRGQFVRVKNRMCVQFVGKLDSSLGVKTQVGKMTEGVRNIDGPTYTKKDSVKGDTTPLQLF